MGEKKTLRLVSKELMDGAALCKVLLCNCEHYQPCCVYSVTTAAKPVQTANRK